MRVSQAQESANLSKMGYRVDGAVDYNLYAHIFNCMESYYIIALSVFVDNMESLAIENCLLRGLENILTPEKITKMSDEEVAELAAESPESASLRQSLLTKKREFEEGHRVIYRYSPRGMAAKSTTANTTTVPVLPTTVGNGTLSKSTLSTSLSATNSTSATPATTIGGQSPQPQEAISPPENVTVASSPANPGTLQPQGKSRDRSRSHRRIDGDVSSSTPIKAQPSAEAVADGSSTVSTPSRSSNGTGLFRKQRQDPVAEGGL